MPVRQSAASISVGTIGIAVLVLALVWLLGRGEQPPGEASPATSAETAAPEAPEGAEPIGEPRAMPPEVAHELATRLARALDGGLRPLAPVVPEGASTAGASGSALAGGRVPSEPPRPAVRLDHPLTASDQMEYASRMHDWIVIRRDDLRQRLEQLEASGQGGSDQADRVRWEIQRLDQTEPEARRQVEELAERARAEQASQPAP